MKRGGLVVATSSLLLATGGEDARAWTQQLTLSADASVTALLIRDGRVYLGGGFEHLTAAGSPPVARAGLAAVSLRSGTLASFGPRVDDSVLSLAVRGST